MAARVAEDWEAARTVVEGSGLGAAGNWAAAAAEVAATPVAVREPPVRGSAEAAAAVGQKEAGSDVSAAFRRSVPALVSS